jgi:hypothetical protein
MKVGGKSVFVAGAVLLLTGGAAAEGNELALLGGAHFPVNSSVEVGTGFAVQGSYSRRLFWVPLVSLYLDLPVVASFNFDVTSPSIPAPQDYSALFFTPGLKVKFAASACGEFDVVTDASSTQAGALSPMDASNSQ